MHIRKQKQCIPRVMKGASASVLLGSLFSLILSYIDHPVPEVNAVIPSTGTTTAVTVAAAKSMQQQWRDNLCHKYICSKSMCSNSHALVTAVCFSPFDKGVS